MPHRPFSRSNPADPFVPRGSGAPAPRPAAPAPVGSGDLELAKGWKRVKARKPGEDPVRAVQHPRKVL